MLFNSIASEYKPRVSSMPWLMRYLQAVSREFLGIASEDLSESPQHFICTHVFMPNHIHFPKSNKSIHCLYWTVPRNSQDEAKQSRNCPSTRSTKFTIKGFHTHHQQCHFHNQGQRVINLSSGSEVYDSWKLSKNLAHKNTSYLHHKTQS